MQQRMVGSVPGSLDGAEVDLFGWKAVADALQVTVRTAQRWERRYGLPVRRFASGTVEASSAMLRRWRHPCRNLSQVVATAD